MGLLVRLLGLVVLLEIFRCGYLASVGIIDLVLLSLGCCLLWMSRPGRLLGLSLA